MKQLKNLKKLAKSPDKGIYKINLTEDNISDYQVILKSINEDKTYYAPAENLKSDSSGGGGGGSSYIPPFLKTGGASWSGTGLVYDVTALEYYFNDDKTTSATQVTLDASDPVNNRLDAIVVDEAGVVSVIKGDASASPISPSVDESHILIQYILVEAGSTEPAIAKEDIYLENVEWTTSTYTTGTATGSIDFDNAVSPKQGVKCISASADARLGARFVRTTSFDPYQYTMLSMWVRFTGSNVATNKSLNVRFENGAGALVANTINLFNFGLQRNLLNVWQLVVIPITSFGALPTSVKGLKIIMTGGTVGQARQWDIDLISLTDNSVPAINEQAFNVLKDGVLVGQSSSLDFKGVAVNVTKDAIGGKIDVEVIGGGSSFITKTKTEMDALITANGLVAGALYEITSVHPTLYDDCTTSGTTIYLRAISGNQLEVQGMGKFYNPKYDKSVDGFGIWDNKMYGTLSNVVGNFDYINKESVTADNSATGLILADGMIQWVSGDWSTAVSITGSVSGATADVVGFVTPSYSIGDKVIWGGYSWTSVNGNVGTSTDVLNLDSEWSKDAYDTTNYNVAYDVIEYDYANDFIVRRCNVEANIDVKCSKAQYDFFMGDGLSFNTLSVQQWGNNYDVSFGKGQFNIICNNGYNESVNFSGALQQYLEFGSGSGQTNLTFGSGSYQEKLTFGSGSQLNYNSQVISSNMQYINFNTKGVTVPDLSAATLLFDGNVKEVYQRPDGALKIRYYDNSDALVIADIAD